MKTGKEKMVWNVRNETEKQGITGQLQIGEAT